MTSAELIQELQAARPAAGDALRERIRELAAREPEPHRSRLALPTLRRRTLVAVPVAAAVALAVAGAIGLSRSGAPTQEGALPATTEDFAARGAQPAPGAKVGGGGSTVVVPSETAASAGSVAPGPTSGRAQRYSAQLTIEVKDADALSQATQRALATVRDLGGYVVSVSYASSQTGSASLTLRVPTEKVQDAIVRLSALGKLVGQQVQIDDLQEQIDALAKQEAALRQQIARLTARLADPGLDQETRTVLEARRAEAQRQLAQVRSARAQTVQEARYATIQLSLQTGSGAGVVPVPSRFERARDEMVSILAWEGIALLYTVAIAGPLALVCLAIWLVARFVRRRGNDRLLAAS